MRVLLDENLPVGLAPLLEGHQVESVSGLQWSGVSNGELLERATGQFDAMITMDRNIEHQQRVANVSLGILLVLAPSNRMTHLVPLVAAMLEGLRSVQPGELRKVGDSPV